MAPNIWRSISVFIFHAVEWLNCLPGAPPPGIHTHARPLVASVTPMCMRIRLEGTCYCIEEFHIINHQFHIYSAAVGNALCLFLVGLDMRQVWTQNEGSIMYAWQGSPIVFTSTCAQCNQLQKSASHKGKDENIININIVVPQPLLGIEILVCKEQLSKRKEISLCLKDFVVWNIVPVWFAHML